jgi:hypothetical protein
LFRGKWEEVKKNLLFLPPLTTKWGSSFISFLLLKRVKLDNLGLFFPYIIFNSNLEKTYSHNLLGEEKNEYFLVDGRKGESRLKGCSSLERMEVGRDSVGTLKS